MDATALPSELLVAPQPLIGFCGLETEHISVHKTVWEAFSSNRKADRAAVQFKLLPLNYDFPMAKTKRNSYEWYHPKGILKRNWMLKHLHVLPAVIVVFLDLDWNDAQWTEKLVQCASMLQTIKNSLQERETRICLVLLQKAAPLPPGEDMLASERASGLTTACGINSKMLFILPHTEHLMGYILRLESAFLDMAQSYYGLMAKRIRTHRDQLTSSHTTLKIRHQFKLGFVSEIRQDFSTALKHYTQSYATLEEIRVTDTNCLEIKIIAGFLNYKICRLMFKLKVPRDAINHFISHVDKYKSRVGFKDLIFEHYAWLSTQHSVFAELFCEAIKNGLPALQIQHPGIYFQKAAEYIVKRREAFLQSCAVLLSPVDPSTPNSLSQTVNLMTLYTEFFGIRSTQTGEPLAEQQINLLIRDAEKNYNHSSAIINLLGQAMAQYKIYKCLRFRKKLSVDMAEEYFKSGDHSTALTLYSLMLPDYRQEKWSSIFSEVLLKTLRCSLLSASISDYITCSLEALSLSTCHDRNERIIVLENLWKVFQGVPPISQYQSAPELREMWENKLSSTSASIPVDLDALTPLFEMCCTFDKMELKNDEVIQIRLIFKLLTDVPLKVKAFCLMLTEGKTTYKLPAKKYAFFDSLLQMRQNQQNVNAFRAFENDIKLEPNIYYQILFSTEAQQFLENTQLRVTRIEAQMGSDKLSALLSKNAQFVPNAFRHYSRSRDVDDNIEIISLCYIAPTFHLNTQSNLRSSMLVNEYYPVVTTISNPYNVYLQNVGMNISVPSNLRNKVFLTTDVSAGRQKLHSQIQVDIGELSMQSSSTAAFYIFSLEQTTIELQQKVWYSIDVVQPQSISTLLKVEPSTPTSSDNSPNIIRSIAGVVDTQANIISPVQIEFFEENRLRKTREDILKIKCGLDFDFTARFYTLSKRPLTKVYKGENFLLRANIEVQADQEIDILENYFICDHNLVQNNFGFKRKKYTNSYKTGEKLEDVIVLRSNATTDDWVVGKEFERLKNEPQSGLFKSQSVRQSNTVSLNRKADAATNQQSNTNLLGKIPNNMTIINNSANASSMLMNTSLNSNMTSSLNSDEGKLTTSNNNLSKVDLVPNDETTSKATVQTRMFYNKAMEAVQVTGHCKGFIKGVITSEASNAPIFGLYCIKWRRHGSNDENESKFVVGGLDIEYPPLNIYCSIEEKMFVKMPITFKVVLKNPFSKILHLTALLSISNNDNFICSGHKQLDISIFAHGEKELVYNLYPLCVGWQNLPELTLEYNTQADPTKDDLQNSRLAELVQQSIPKKVFVLPPLKQQLKY